MPCTDGGWNEIERQRAQRELVERLEIQLEATEAMLCGVLRAVEATKHFDAMLSYYENNAKETGVTTQRLYNWWADHKKKDIARRKAERAAAARKAADKAHAEEADRLRKLALKKLSSAERKALGLKP